uniref:Arrestin_C domain-containing protein n=1 Tax=Caenorhabditis tropicalis TaxID=1561998 RepID=A0A1I7TA02_9PELO
MPFIVFEKPDPIYYPGDTVSGRVLFETSEPISARSIIINITGFTATWNINWCERNCRKFLFKRSMVAWVSPDGTRTMHLKTEMIVFDAPSALYTPGQTLTGKFFLPITKPTHIDSVKLKIKGVSKTSWDRVEKVGEWHHISDTIVIDDAPKDYIVPGNYPIPFEFSLPSHLPPTFISQTSKIRYEIKILVHKKRDDYPNYVSREFFVVRRMSIDEWRSLELRLRNNHVFNSPVSSFFKDCGSFKINLHCNQRILSPGKEADLSARLTNESTKTIEKVSVKLLAKVHAFSNSSTCNRAIHLLLERQSLQIEIMPGEMKEQLCKITVPSNIVPTFDSKIIKVDYYLRITIHFKGMFNRCISFQKILIVGIHENDDQEYVPTIMSAQRYDESFNEVVIGEESVGPPDYEEIVQDSVEELPPSYAEAVNA